MRRDWPGLLLAVVLTLVIIFPLIVVAVWSVSNVWRYPSVVPQELGLKFWHTTLARADVWTSITLSVSLATVVTLISAAICLPAAYAFARLEFPFRNLLFFSFLQARPPSGRLPPHFTAPYSRSQIGKVAVMRDFAFYLEDRFQKFRPGLPSVRRKGQARCEAHIHFFCHSTNCASRSRSGATALTC